MGRELLTVLTDDVESTERNASKLSDDDLRALYEALVLSTEIDRRFAALQRDGSLPFFVPSGNAAAVSAGAARAFDEGDWLYPSFRDLAAFLVRGGSIEKLVAQLLGGRDDASRGRQLPGHLTLPSGRFVSISGALATHLQQAVGTALSMRLRDELNVAGALFGAAALRDPASHAALEAARRLRAPLVFVCRTTGTERPTATELASVLGLETRTADGGDVLAVHAATREARARAARGKGPTLVEAVVAPPSEATLDLGGRLRSFMEHRGIWDSGRDEDYLSRCRERLDAAIATVQSGGGPATASMFDDVYAERPWMLREQSRLAAREGA